MVIFTDITKNECINERYLLSKSKYDQYCGISWKRHEIRLETKNERNVASIIYFLTLFQCSDRFIA